MPRVLRSARLVDLAIALGIAAMAQAMVWSGQVAGPRVWMSFLFILVGLPLLVRRKRPLAPVVLLCVAVLTQAVTTRDSAEGGALVLAANVAVYSVAAYGSRKLALSGLVLFMATYAVSLAEDPLVRTSDEKWAAAFFGLLPVVSSAAGLAMRAGRETHRLAEETAERNAREAAALAQERARIARELHDVIAHNVSVVVLHAMAAQGVLESDPSRARAPLDAIERSGRLALVELRRLLDVMRSEDTLGGPLHPQPGYPDVTTLVDGVRTAGLKTTLAIQGDPPQSPASLALTIYRVVQESLTNVLKHASAGQVEISIQYAPDHATVDIVDNGHGPKRSDGISQVGGYGLQGMRERVSLFGGSLEAGGRPEGGFQVRAVLPYSERE